MNVRCKVLLDIETSFDDNESTAETLLYCLQEDFSESKYGLADVYTIHSAKIIEEHNPPHRI